MVDIFADTRNEHRWFCFEVHYGMLVLVWLGLIAIYACITFSVLVLSAFR